MNHSSNKNLKHVVIFSPSGALIEEALLDRACVQLQTLGFTTTELAQTRLRVERFAGDEASRALGIETSIGGVTPSVLLASRGGYGLSRLLPMLDFDKLAEQLNLHGHVVCGHSDLTSLQLALLNAGAKPETLLHGPMACFDFGPEQGVDPLTAEHFLGAIEKGQVDIQWNAGVASISAPDELVLNGPVWGGNLTLLCSLLGTPWLPEITGGLLVLEDVNEPAYKIERMLLQLLHAGVLARQQAIVLGNFCEPKPGSHDNGYNLQSAAQFVEKQLGNIPVLLNFPFGHCTPKVCWFQGGQGVLNVRQGQTARLTQNLR